MRLFTTRERDSIQNIIVEELKKTDDVLAIILVGSGAVGFTDKFSDLDFSIVVDDECNINTVMHHMNQFICEQWRLLNWLEMQNAACKYMYLIIIWKLILIMYPMKMYQRLENVGLYYMTRPIKLMKLCSRHGRLIKTITEKRKMLI